MIRHSSITPGYDCIATPCGKNGCGTHPGSSHGRHCDDWIYVVKDGDCALSLTVFAGNYPGTSLSREPSGADLSLHVAWPTQREQVAQGETDSECAWVTGGRCWLPWTSTSLARDFFAEHGDLRAFEQPETFWLAMETECAELAIRFRAERADIKWERCACCDGTGASERKATS